MSGLSFPRHSSGGGRSAPPPPGHPARANPCACVGGPVLFRGDDECARCGRYPSETIGSTWAHRAQMLARVANARRMRDARKRRP
jgi:hypothetical protein